MGGDGGGARMLVGGAWIARDEAIEVRNPFDRRLVDTVPPGTPADIASAIAAVQGLHVGAVIVDDSTDYRLDVMPFGGTKPSGIGREGVRFALREMTETRVACFNL